MVAPLEPLVPACPPVAPELVPGVEPVSSLQANIARLEMKQLA